MSTNTRVYGRTLHDEISAERVASIVSEHYAREGMEVAEVLVSTTNGTARIYREIDLTVKLPTQVAAKEESTVLIFIRDSLQYCAYHCDQMGAHGLCSWFQTKACHVQDNYID